MLRSFGAPQEDPEMTPFSNLKYENNCCSKLLICCPIPPASVSLHTPTSVLYPWHKLLFLFLLSTLTFVTSHSQPKVLRPLKTSKPIVFPKLTFSKPLSKSTIPSSCPLITLGMFSSTTTYSAKPIYSGKFYWPQFSGRTAAIYFPPASQCTAYVGL